MAQTQSKTEAAALRKFLNKREDIAVQILAGLMQNPALTQIAIIREGLRQGEDYRSINLRPVAEATVEAADALLQKLYVHEEKAATE